MLIVTSLSPHHSNFLLQLESVESWSKFGKCYSLNVAKEIEQLQPLYPSITFVETHKTVESLFQKPYVTINAIMDFAIEKDEDLLIINSDIILTELPPLHTNGLTIFSRWDYTDHFGDARLFVAGYDVFYLPKTFLKVFPPSIYSLGQTFWDHALPYRFIINNIPVYWAKEKCAFHKLHRTQWKFEDWEKMGRYFQWEFNLNKNLSAGQIATHSLQTIHLKAIR